MKYQLVVQFPEEKFNDFDWYDKLDEKFTKLLGDEAEFDGNDVGGGILNLFIHTNNLIATFEIVKIILQEEDPTLKDVKIAYRDFNDEDYTCLWPTDLVEFDL